LYFCCFCKKKELIQFFLLNFNENMSFFKLNRLVYGLFVGFKSS
jgi:hypothetical protein